MNPFAWPGPEFVKLYLVLGIVAVIACLVRTRFFGGGGAVSLTTLTADPYRIGFLRGGEEETARLAIFNLVDRGILACDGTNVTVTRPDGAELLRRALDRELVKKTGTGSTVSDLETSPGVLAQCRAYESELRAQGLLPDKEEIGSRRMFGWAAVGLLAGIAAVKVVKAMSEGRTNIGFIFVLAVLISVAVVWACSYTRTSSGRRTLGSLEVLMKRLKANVKRLKAGGTSNEALIFASVYGLEALPAGSFPLVERMFPKRVNETWERFTSFDSSCGSSCSSSCSSSCGGGGGCGGCGSD